MGRPVIDIQMPLATAPPSDVLRRLLDDAVDDDYSAASRHDRQLERPTLQRPTAAAIVVVVAFGLFVGIAAGQARSGAPQEARERSALFDRIETRQDAIAALTSRSEQLRLQILDLQGSATEGNQRARDLLAGLTTARTLTGAATVIGPGVEITADDAPGGQSGPEGKVLDVDLQVLVNGLWQAGAEAVAINGNRLSPLSAIRTAGRAITVNYRSLSPPYIIEAIGDPQTLQARFIETPGGQAWLDLATNFGLGFELDSADSLRLAAAPAPRLLIRYAQRQGELP